MKIGDDVLNRVVKFRGKSLITVEELDRMEIKHENGWVFGNLISNGKFPWIVGDVADWGEDYIAHEWFVAVDPDTVGQFTGVPDKDGREIYDKDIIKMGGILHRVEWSGKYVGYRLSGRGVSTSLNIYHKADYEVIGDVHENPELLEAAK